MNKSIHHFISEKLSEHQTVIQALVDNLSQIELATNKIIHSFENGGKLFIFGNGGSAADAQHIAAELIGRFKKERLALPAIALTTDTSTLTALSNDYDYNIVFSRQIEALCQPKDCVLGISTSGKSKNVVRGLLSAKRIGAYTIGLTGCDGADVAEVSDNTITVPSKTVARIQEAHLFIAHCICEWIEEKYVQVQNATMKSEDSVLTVL